MKVHQGLIRAVAVGVSLSAAVLGGPGALAPASVLADGPFIIGVTTASDIAADDGLCSLREAINVSNTGGYSGLSFGECQGSSSLDRIQFVLGSGVPVITLASDLPPITTPVRILGNTGGASHVRITRANGSNGLWIQSGATGTTIRGLRIDGFADGIHVDAANVTIVGNWIGPNSVNGVTANGANVLIGGTNPLDPNAPCSGDCNLIKGNATRGLYLNHSGTVSGNLIGIDASGTVATTATANGTGIVITQGTWTVGGTALGQGNVISGNAGGGLFITHCTTCTVQGNRIGTNVGGTAKVPNGADGIHTDGNTTIGGPSPEAGNLISGNGDDGIEVAGAASSVSENVLIYGNRIGTTAGGAAMGNSGIGIFLGGWDNRTVRNVIIGAPSLPGSANVIANSKGVAGVYVRQSADNVEIRGNSIHDNAPSFDQGILVLDPGNEGMQRPVITGLGPLHGTACASCTIDVYSDSADEGRIYQGATTTDGSGNWSYAGSLTGPKVTATATNATHSTSMFATPYTLPTPRKPDGRIRKGTGSLVGNNIYNLTGLNQTKTGSTTRGNTITFGLSIQNDAASDRFKVLASGSGTTQYTVSYFRNSTNITAAVVAGTYTTPTLANGGTFLITAKVKVNTSATVGSSVARLVTISSVADPTKNDAVKFVGKRS